jgi:hypothetical protein
MTYRERRERRVERLQEWAGKREAKSAAAFEGADRIASQIPFGQPILIGHHSQRHAENDRDRIDSGMQRGLEHSRKAEEFTNKAENIESALARSIYSDDPDAIEALQARIAGLEAERDRIKAFNVTARKGQPDESLLTEQERASLESERRFSGGYVERRRGQFPAYHLANLNGNISRNRERLAALQAKS